MDEREQKRRERAYKIWEDEGRVDGLHEDHWKHAAKGRVRGERHRRCQIQIEEQPGQRRRRWLSAGWFANSWRFEYSTPLRLQIAHSAAWFLALRRGPEVLQREA